MDRTRCSWYLGNDLLLAYHDQEWGVPVHADRKHFEYLTLEVMQSPAKSSVRKREKS